MSKEKEQKDFEEEILRIYEEIKSTKKSISKIIDIQETALISPLDSTSVNSGFGARWGGTHNGVDLAANAANVKSPADGVVFKVAKDEPPCGGTIIIDHADGYRTGFCHMQKINVSTGQEVKQGDIIGVSGGGANDPGRGKSDGRHLHFTLRKDGNLVNPMDYIGKDGINIMGEPPKDSSSDSSSSSTTDSSSEKAYNDAVKASSSSTGSFWDTGSPKDTFMLQSVKSIADKFLSGLKEQKDFGNDISNRYGRIIIPKDTNSRIKSPVSGVVDNSRYVSGCVNQIIISTKSNRYLQFCGISKPSVGNGQSISRGTLLGITDTDVEVTMFDSSWNTVPIESNSTSSLLNKNSKEDKKNNSNNSNSSFWNPDGGDKDPLLTMVTHLPSKIIDKVFGDRYDEKTGKMTQKRWGGVADKRPVDPWVIDAIKKPFSKKVNEDIERIKKLL